MVRVEVLNYVEHKVLVKSILIPCPLCGLGFFSQSTPWNCGQRDINSPLGLRLDDYVEYEIEQDAYEAANLVHILVEAAARE